MHSSYQEPESNRDYWSIAPMRQPPGPIYAFDTMVGYILGYRAYEAGELPMQNIEILMVLNGFESVSAPTIRRWAHFVPDLPERRAVDGHLPHRDIPKLFRDQLRTFPGLARLGQPANGARIDTGPDLIAPGQPEYDFFDAVADAMRAVAVAVAAIWALKQLSKPTDIIEPPYERRIGSRIGRVSRRSGFFRVNRR